LRQLLERGCDLGAPHVHVDVTTPDGLSHAFLVEEVIEWLNRPEQASFVEREGLEALLQAAAE
jgi:hypothetical protein